MADLGWQGQGPEFSLSWAGSSWRLRLDGPRPGLELSGSDRTILLALEGLAAIGRSCRWQTERPLLTKVDRLFDRVEATYAFPTWGGLTVRASWNFVREIEGVDLEVQILADSVDFLKALEVQVITQVNDPREAGVVSPIGDFSVEPRDREAAASSYDGREASVILQSLWTRPVPSPATPTFGPKVIDTPWLEAGLRYIELVHPDDVARRIGFRPASSNQSFVFGEETTTRYGLFGHDLEKGVLLRSRMRGLWARTSGAISNLYLDAKFLEFREGPLPLGP